MDEYCSRSCYSSCSSTRGSDRCLSFDIESILRHRKPTLDTLATVCRPMDQVDQVDCCGGDKDDDMVSSSLATTTTGVNAHLHGKSPSTALSVSRDSWPPHPTTMMTSVHFNYETYRLSERGRCYDCRPVTLNSVATAGSTLTDDGCAGKSSTVVESGVVGSRRNTGQLRSSSYGCLQSDRVMPSDDRQPDNGQRASNVDSVDCKWTVTMTVGF